MRKAGIFFLMYISTTCVIKLQGQCTDPVEVFPKLVKPTPQPFDWFQCLQTYWNYRYHFNGDHICPYQYLPWDDKFVTEIGEAGMVVIGMEQGNSIPVSNILLPKQYDCSMDKQVDDYDHDVIYTGTAQYNNIVMSYGGDGSWYSPAFAAENDKPIGGCWPLVKDGQIPSGTAGVVTFDDNTPQHLAVYIELLATEWALLHKWNKSTVATETELYNALNAVRRLDYFSSNSQFSQNFPEREPDGFFYRCDANWDLAIGNNFGTPNSLEPGGNSSGNELVTSEDACLTSAGDCGGWHGPGQNYPGEMSGDCDIYMMLAYRFVTQLITPDATDQQQLANQQQLVNMAKAEAGAITSWAEWHDGIGIWTITDPDGHTICTGGWEFPYAFDWANAAKKITGGDGSPSAPYLPYPGFILSIISCAADLHDASIMSTSGPFASSNLLDLYDFHANLATAGDMWKKSEGAGKIGQRLFHNSQDQLAEGYVTVHFDLVNAVLNNKPVRWIPKNEYEGILARQMYACYPLPVNNNDGIGWCMPTYTNWMLLFNLYTLYYGPPAGFFDLATGGTPVEYTNLKKRVVTNNFPFTSSCGGTIGNISNPATIAAADTLLMQGHITGAVDVTEMAPHLQLLPGTYILPTGGKVIAMNQRMPCTSNEFTSSCRVMLQHKQVPIDTSDDEDAIILPPVDSMLQAVHELQSYLNSADVPSNIKEQYYATIAQVYSIYKDSLSALPNQSDLAAISTSTNDSVAAMINIYPNPNNGNFKIEMDLPNGDNIGITIYDMMGNLVAERGSTYYQSGTHTLDFDGRKLGGGVYMARIKGTGFSAQREVIIQM